jgi:alkylation response protein AidB-like acyl-CoA dehydrogenase
LAVNQALNLATLTLSAQLSGLMRGALDLTLEHLRTRTQFGQAIGSFQALQHRAVDLHIQHALAEAAVREAAHLYDADADSPRTAFAISAAKARASAGALLICKEAVQMHGAIGFTLESDVGLFLRAALRWSSWLGEAGAHRRRLVTQKGGDDA